ncbi:MAG: DNA (cytosine-5-)-methyltransferase [Clostridia bacterium]|nr:DNA (cytosine-5-)-methyltransferase [Clostridia bacterium]
MNYFNDNKFTFIDLFAGIGGFHLAMSGLGGKCVLASEIDAFAIESYKLNYGIDSANDVTLIENENIPDHDVLCGGFPCQAFSKAGQQQGFADQTKGTLFFQIVRILKAKRPKFIILENVRNLVSHDCGNTWRVIKRNLTELGYVLSDNPIIMSPHQLGVPQLRERVYILGVHKSLGINHLNFTIPYKDKSDLDVFGSGIIDENADEKYNISETEEKVLSCWDEFYKGIKEKVIGFPIWATEFKQTYDTSNLPKWKADFCRKNRDLYANNKDFIDLWLKKWNNLDDFTPTQKKFEWQAGNSISSLWDGFIQFRPSGIRVKRPDSFPALVAMVQIPIIGKFKRRLTPREAARLQSFPDDFIPNENDHQAYKQFGNAVNVNCVSFLAQQLFNIDQHDKGEWDPDAQLGDCHTQLSLF